MRCGILSDSHDRLPASIHDAFAGVDRILHAGDICSEDILTELESIAPVIAVHGNCDRMDLVEKLPEQRLVEFGGTSITLLHGHRLRRGCIEDIADLCHAGAPDVVIFGHSHEPLSKVLDGTHYFNPGTAGGWGRAPTAGLLTIGGPEPVLTHIPLAR